jgi:feruloyl esterase
MVSDKKEALDSLRGYGVGNIRSFVVKDWSFDGPFDPAKYKAQMIAASKMFDMNDPNLGRFKAHGGKLIIKSNAADYVVSPMSVWRYYENVVKTMGKASTDEFVRLYVAPYVGHGGSGVSATTGAQLPDKVDLLGQLDAWSDGGKVPPDHLTLTAYTKDNMPESAWPMCRYPAYPHYKGKGDPKAADSYSCAAH